MTEIKQGDMVRVRDGFMFAGMIAVVAQVFDGPAGGRFVDFVQPCNVPGGVPLWKLVKVN